MLLKTIGSKSGVMGNRKETAINFITHLKGSSSSTITWF